MSGVSLRVLMMVPGVLPFHTGGGVAMVNWAIMKELRARGHKVNVATDQDNSTIEVLQSIIDSGVNISKYDGDLGSIEGFSPDVVFCYTVSVLQKCKLDQSIPRVVALVDLDHLINLYRRQYYERSRPIAYAELVAIHQHAMGTKDAATPLLQQCNNNDISGVIEHAYHHNEWLNNVAGVNSTYIPMPVIDPVFRGWERDRRSYPQDSKGNGLGKVSMAGHLRGIATLSGLYFLAEDILPHLSGVDVKIAGAESLFPDLATRLDPYLKDGSKRNLSVNLLGFVPDIQREMLNSNVVLVPTPIDLGFRTRIVEAWSLGCCVVTHPANLLGMPEAEPGKNILVGSNGKEIAEIIMEASRDIETQVRIGREARKSYEEHYMGSEKKVVDLIERAATAATTKAAAGEVIPVGVS